MNLVFWAHIKASFDAVTPTSRCLVKYLISAVCSQEYSAHSRCLDSSSRATLIQIIGDCIILLKGGYCS